MKEKEKQKEINSLLGSVGDERYALLVRLGKKITDYGVDKQLTAAAEGEPRPSGRENGCRWIVQLHRIQRERSCPYDLIIHGGMQTI